MTRVRTRIHCAFVREPSHTDGRFRIITREKDATRRVRGEYGASDRKRQSDRGLVSTLLSGVSHASFRT